MVANLWSWLLAGLVGLINALIIPLFGGPTAYHQAMGLASIMGTTAYTVLEVSMIAIGNFNLGLPIAAILINFILMNINIFIRIWLTIKSIVKVW